MGLQVNDLASIFATVGDTLWPLANERQLLPDLVSAVCLNTTYLFPFLCVPSCSRELLVRLIFLETLLLLKVLLSHSHLPVLFGFGCHLCLQFVTFHVVVKAFFCLGFLHDASFKTIDSLCLIDLSKRISGFRTILKVVSLSFCSSR